jgi:hypothetical protein
VGELIELANRPASPIVIDIGWAAEYNGLDPNNPVQRSASVHMWVDRARGILVHHREGHGDDGPGSRYHREARRRRHPVAPMVEDCG